MNHHHEPYALTGIIIALIIVVVIVVAQVLATAFGYVHDLSGYVQ